MGVHWVLQASGEPREASGCRGESAEPKPLSHRAVTVENPTCVRPRDHSGPGHKEGGAALRPQHSFPRKGFASVALQLQPQGEGRAQGQFRRDLSPIPAWLQPGGRTQF